ncbi:hypothetical protein AGMMS49982_17010 [Bacteroidia bacterium]|nr:hypothetical protein AGMMS49982_17010 [Bacteroidia bacterium]
MIDRPDVRLVIFTVTSSNKEHTKTYTLILEKRFPFDEIVTTRWNNTMTVRNNPETNGGYRFQSFLWYRKSAGSMYFLPLATGQSYSAGNNGEQLQSGDSYFLEMVTDAGLRFHTCEGIPQLRNISVDAYPNPVVRSSLLNVAVEAEADLLNDATIEIYNMQGLLLETVPVNGKTTVCASAALPGIYLYVFRAKTGFYKEAKVFVK